MTNVSASVAVGRDDVAAAGGTLARAFQLDPLWAAVWPDDERRRDQLLRMFTALVATTRAARAPARALPDGSAVALWNQPGTYVRLRASLRAGFVQQRAVLAMSASERRRFLRTVTMFERRRQALMPMPHWYLQAIGVDPDRHGRGRGTTLVREGLARADRDGVPVYLETETERNVAFYTGLGFRVLEQHAVEALDQLPVWLMRADPATSGD
jgi:ribosomal protein S18 acetylase RimI-like enzyme